MQLNVPINYIPRRQFVQVKNKLLYFGYVFLILFFRHFNGFAGLVPSNSLALKHIHLELNFSLPQLYDDCSSACPYNAYLPTTSSTTSLRNKPSANHTLEWEEFCLFKWEQNAVEIKQTPTVYGLYTVWLLGCLINNLICASN